MYLSEGLSSVQCSYCTLAACPVPVAVAVAVACIALLSQFEFRPARLSVSDAIVNIERVAQCKNLPVKFV